MDDKKLFGIQGGLGSYNDTAIRKHLSNNYRPDRVLFLDSTPNVFKALAANEIHYGQFALFNNKSGLYRESLDHVAKNTFRVEESYSIPVNHALMLRKDKELKEITRIVTHKEVIKQCQKNVAEKFSHIKIEFTAGELIDPSNVALAISEKEDFHDTAVMGNPTLAEIYDLRVAQENLSDGENSYSTFLLISRLR